MATKTKAAPADLSQEFASTADGRDITRPWVTDLQQAKDPRLNTSVDWGTYDRIRKDDQVKSCLEQRIAAVVSAEWDVLPGDDTDPRSVKAAEAFKANLERVGWDQVTKKMLYAPFHGIAIAELLWEARDGLIQLGRIKVRHARRFRFDKDDALRLITSTAPRGEIVPDKKFWVVKSGGTDDDEPYGEGLADWLYWPTLFKRNGVRFWNIFLDKFGSPTKVATYRRGATRDEINKVTALLRSAANDSGIAVPEGFVISLLEAARSGSASYKDMCTYMDEAIAKIILSQTMTTQDGASLSQAQVHAGVKLEVVKADADLLSDSFNEGPARWWCELNFGPDVAPPQLVRLVEEEADLKMLAETDKILAETGWVRSDESFKDTYGDGYERKQPAEAPKDSGKAVLETPVNDNGRVEPVSTANKDKAAVSFAAPTPRPLYVYRSLKNTKEVLAWAKGQGFTSTLPAADLHVTICYSKRPVDWFKMGSAWGTENGGLIIAPGGARVVATLGENATVLMFSSADLEWRHENMVDAGASWDFPSYHPHVTISYDGAPADLAAVEPYTGKLVFGHEIFEPLDEDWKAGLSEASFAEMATGDVVDQIAADLLAEHGWKPLSAQMSKILRAIEASETPEQLDEELLKTLDPDEREAFTQIIARSTFATRIGEESGA
jgi:phage gp29-like protein